MGLVVHRQGPVDEPGRDEQPAPPVRVRDEGRVAPERRDALLVLSARLVIGRLVRLSDVRVVAARPLPLLVVPPQVALALGPGLSVRVSGGAVVEDARVGGPRPYPF